MGSGEDEGFEHLFGEVNDGYRPAKQLADKLLPYERSTTGETLLVHVVGHHVLWANYLWNGSHWMCDYIDEHPDQFRDISILELGAGAGLPSILAAQAGASRVVITDYPDEELLVNIEKNIGDLLNAEQRSRVVAWGHLWGSDHSGLLNLNCGQQFDMIFLCDVIFNHSEHRALLQTITRCLKPTGLAWCVFSHYRPWIKDRDLELLRLATEEYGLCVEKIAEQRYDEPVIEETRADPEVLKTVYAYRFSKLQ